MAYIFRKLNNLIDNPQPAIKPQGQIIGQGGGNLDTTDANIANKSSHESNFKNPNAVYEANYGADMGTLNSGINQSLNDANSQLQTSTKDYQNKLNNVGDNYKYNGRNDVENINDKDVYNRLSKLTNPDVGRNALGSVESKSKYYNADTSATANLSTVEGLTNQLQNQNSSTRGGSRLDALLYRNSGQAGRAINNDLKQIDTFRDGKTQLLNNEKNVLNNHQQTVTNNSSKLKSDGDTYRQDLLRSAKNSASEMQARYNAAHEAEVQKLENWKKSLDLRNAIASKIEEGKNGRTIVQNVTADTPGAIAHGGDINPETGRSSRTSYTKDVSYDVVNKLIDNTIKEMNFSNVDANNYLPQAKSYNENMFLDSRFNLLGQLLNLEQKAAQEAPDLSINVNTKGYQDAINAIVNEKANKAKEAADLLFTEPAGGGGRSALENLINDPILRGIATGGQSILNGNFIESAFNNISNIFKGF